MGQNCRASYRALKTEIEDTKPLYKLLRLGTGALCCLVPLKTHVELPTSPLSPMWWPQAQAGQWNGDVGEAKMSVTLAEEQGQHL